MKLMTLETKRRIYKRVAVLVLISFFTQILAPTVGYALTSGPSQPEVQSFEPIGTTEMVDLFSGDFTYNIPLFELPGPNGGYPFNLAYHSGVTMDQEASWVGLGWNINPGVINRQMRGLPDDFDGDIIKKDLNMKPNITIGANYNKNKEIWGADLAKLEEGVGLALSVGVGVYYNNYRGLGYNLSPGLGFHKVTSNHFSANLGLNLSLDSQEGLGFNPALSLSQLNKEKERKFEYGGSLGANYSSRRGLMDITLSTKVIERAKDKEASGYKSVSGASSSSSLSFAQTARVPQIQQAMLGQNLNVSYKFGSEGGGILSGVSLSGYYNSQGLLANHVQTKGYGYLNYQNALDEDLLDFNREKDGMIRRNMTNLAAPNLTYDVYSVSGQGTGGMYRPVRNDVGIIRDQEIKSKTIGGQVGFEAGQPAVPGGSTHLGFDAGLNHSSTRSGSWKENDNDLSDIYDFKKTSDGNEGLFKPYRFKTYGEHTARPTNYLDYIGGENPVAIKINSNQKAENKLLKREVGVGTTEMQIDPEDGQEADQGKANMAIQSFTNEELRSGILKEFNVEYYGVSGDAIMPVENLDRMELKGNHIGGITATNPNGLRYNYGLPAYNKKQIEYNFTVEQSTANRCEGTVESNYVEGKKYAVEGTDKYRSVTEIPEYAHSFFLTSIVGPDYIDADEIDGPSAGDLGYWVKFNYTKTSSGYKWRAPYLNANYAPGSNATVSDDKGAFIYGEKELYYLRSAETRTHVAIFDLSLRNDGKGAKDVVNDDPLTAQQPGQLGAQFKIDKISLFTRAEYDAHGLDPRPIKEVHFEYNYALCPNVPNNDGGFYDPDNDGINDNQGGKLTLKKVYFTYGKNRRGRLSPYEFKYDENNPLYNPEYNMFAVDRWGNYQVNSDLEGAVCENSRFPYVNQDESDEERNREKSVWHLRTIDLPSGGEINVEYEADDYSSVQHKDAMRMFAIESLHDANFVGDANEIKVSNNANATMQERNEPADEFRRIYFKLANPEDYPFTSNPSEVDALNENLADDYLGGIDKLYYNVHAYLRKPTEPLIKDYVAGYADIEAIGLDGTRQSANSSTYTHAYVQLKLGKIPRGNFDANNEESFMRQYHPLSLAIWQHLRINHPELMDIPGQIKEGENLSIAQKAAKVRELVSIIGGIRDAFQGFYDKAFAKDWGTKLILKGEYPETDPQNPDTRDNQVIESFIRLKNPTKAKFGGGNRVKEVRIKDAWDAMTVDEEAYSEYGQVYSYTDKTGRSSGVATYEPMIGGDENPWRTPNEFSEDLKLRTNNNLFFENPVNEQYFPGASVGYSCVEVRSLALDKLTKNLLPDGTGTTGSTVNEFYTAKDFPVKTSQTDLREGGSHPTMEVFKLIVPIPLIGMVKQHKLTATQGYYIELNNMHGKPRKVASYAHDESGVKIENPISSVEYFYKQKLAIENGDPYNELDNEVTVIESDNFIDNPLDIANPENNKAIVGVDYEFFTDMRENRTVSVSGGLNFNIKQWPAPLPPIPLPWPSMSETEDHVRLAVTNKIVHKSGILDHVVASNEASKVVTQNLAFDAQTGRAVLTRVNNNYDDPVFNYNMPAHWQYKGMASAYDNLGMSFKLAGAQTNRDGEFELGVLDLGTEVISKLRLGDEFIVSDGTNKEYVQKIVFAGLDPNQVANGIFTFLSDDKETSIPAGSTVLLTRSGARNHLETDMTSITALSDPTIGRAQGTCLSKANYIENVQNTQIVINEPFVGNLVKGLNALFTADRTVVPSFTIQNGGSCTASQAVTADYDWYRWENGGVGAEIDPSEVETFQVWKYKNTDIASVIVESPRFNLYNASDDGRQQFGLVDLETNDNRFHVIFSQENQCFVNYGVANCIIPSDLEAASGTGPNCLLPLGCDGYASNSAFFRFLDENNQAILMSEIAEVESYALEPNPSGTDFILKFTLRKTDNSTLIAESSYLFENTGISNRWSLLLEEKFTELGPENILSENVPVGKINNVLNISAQSFSDNWNQDFYETKEHGEKLNGLNAFSSGEKGIWRPEETYAYVAKRNQRKSVDTRKDGTMDDVAIFNHTVADFDECSEPWRLVNEVTKYSVYGDEVENRDILNRRSSAVYSHNGNYVAALAQNSAYCELGYESFENYSLDNHGEIWSQLANCSGNLEFANSLGNSGVIQAVAAPNLIKFKTVDIRMAKDYIAILDMPYDADLDWSTVKIAAHYRDKKDAQELYYEVKVQDYYEDLGDQTRSFLVIDQNDLTLNGFWKGKVSFTLESTYAAEGEAIGFVNGNKAHTGDKSLAIIPNATNFFIQNGLDLRVGVNYELAAWISSDEDNVPSFAIKPIIDQSQVPAIIIHYLDKDGVSIRTQQLNPDGPVVEGWQQIEGNVLLQTGERKIALQFQNKTPVNFYFDDIRIFPFLGNMESYVYDVQTNNLTDILDNNNYSSHYVYDEQGNLTVLKKETERGIRTIQESRTHISERGQ